ncbi:GIY-YIG nuclease family protein [Bacillus paranthracis]|uniref:GIY-YIG nuclease family protein n=1 Tax=Bacillus paranthracis TaxID=2026186 RepID=UPI00065BB80B
MSDIFDELIKDPEFSSLLSEIFPANNSDDVLNNIERLVNGTDLFGTIIVDYYKKTEAELFYNLLNSVCNKQDSYSFDCFGVYFFWDFYTKEILYIGYTSNLRGRFGQHNGLEEVKNPNGIKYEEICNYFKTKEKLGYSILVQSPFKHKANSHFYTKDKEVKIIEGAILEEYRKKFSKYPSWNKRGGDKLGRSPKIIKRYGNIFEMITLSQPSFLNAKSTLREIAAYQNVRSTEFELNSIRSYMYKYGEDFESAIEKLLKYYKFMAQKGFLAGLEGYTTLELLRNADYLKKQIIL